MTDHVAALKRQRAHLMDVGADEAKINENAELLRLAGVDLDKEELEDGKRKAAPEGRTAGKRQTAARDSDGKMVDPNSPNKAGAEKAPNRADKPDSGSEPNADNPSKDVTGSGGITLPKSDSKG